MQRFFFSVKKSNYQLRLLKFLINVCKIQSQKYFRAVCCRVSRFFVLIFHATSKNKRDTCSDLGVAPINFRPSASTPKYAKRDPFLDADAFGVVRNCHRIRASGNGIFLHMVKYDYFEEPPRFFILSAALEQLNLLIEHTKIQTGIGDGDVCPASKP